MTRSGIRERYKFRGKRGLRQPMRLCPVKNKRMYVTHGEAFADMARINATGKDIARPITDFYRCEHCQHYHHTSQPRPEPRLEPKEEE